MNQVTPIETQVPVATEGNALSMPALIAEMLRDPNSDVRKFEVLVKLYRDIQREDEIDRRKIAFISAMKAAQQEMKPVARNALNTETNSRHATYDAIDVMVRPIYTKHGFTVSFDTETEPNVLRVYCIVEHVAGGCVIRNFDVPFDTTGPKGTPNKTLVHGASSALSYGQRRTLGLAFNIAFTNEDDDGNAAGVRHTDNTSPTKFARIERLIKETGTDVGRFLAYWEPGGRQITDIRPLKLDACITVLETKKRKAAEKQAA